MFFVFRCFALFFVICYLFFVFSIKIPQSVRILFPVKFLFKGTLMQIWKSVNILAFLWI